MSEIPEDVMREAKILANGIIPSMCMTYDHSFGLMRQKDRDGLLLTFSQISDREVRPVIIKAILAERERCAKIAEEYGEGVSYGLYANTAAAMEASEKIAAAIRGTSPS